MNTTVATAVTNMARRQAAGTTCRHQVAGDNTPAAVAAGVTVLICVLAHLPDRLLQLTGIRSWAAALVGVMVLVNGARVVAQAPFTFADRSASAVVWAADQLKALASMIVAGAALTLPLYALIRATPVWWLWAWALFALVTIGGQVAMPVLVRAQSGPLVPAPGPLAERVRAIGARAGVDVGGGALLTGKAMGRRPGCNAYLLGLGPTRRVVLEPGLAAWPPESIDQVVAHELGHWRLGHTARRLPVVIAAQFATFAFAGAMLRFGPFLGWAGIARAGDPRSYPLLLALTTVVALPARLLLAAHDRGQERAADRFAIAVLGSPHDFAAMLDRAVRDGGAARQLCWWRRAAASHPPIDERIRACHAFAAGGVQP